MPFYDFTGKRSARIRPFKNVFDRLISLSFLKSYQFHAFLLGYDWFRNQNDQLVICVALCSLTIGQRFLLQFLLPKKLERSNLRTSVNQVFGKYLESKLIKQKYLAQIQNLSGRTEFCMRSNFKVSMIYFVYHD